MQRSFPRKKNMTAEEEKAAINRISAWLKVEMADVLEMQCCHASIPKHLLTNFVSHLSDTQAAISRRI